MLVSCACGAFEINPEHSDYVRNGVPVCNNSETCRKVKWHREHGFSVPLASEAEANRAGG